MAVTGQCMFGAAVTTLFHPIAYAKVLIQVMNGLLFDSCYVLISLACS